MGQSLAAVDGDLLHEAIERAMRGGKAQADDLICAVWPQAYRIAYSVTRNRMFAEDAAQEACAALFRSITKLRCADAFGVWFYRIVVRCALAVERRNAAVQLHLDERADSRLDDSLVRIDVCQALAQLTRVQRISVALHYYAEMNSREIAAVLNIPDSSVRFHIMRAKRTLEKALKDHGANNKENSGAA